MVMVIRISTITITQNIEFKCQFVDFIRENIDNNVLYNKINDIMRPT